MTTAPNLRADAFAGTAAAYLRYRPPYPAALLTDLLARAARPPDAALLDLASGPGRLALDLAASFDEVWAIDLEPEMVAVGAEAAVRRGIVNIRWSVGRAEDALVAPNTVDLITIGEAFHRLDQALILERALVWLKPGGCLAILGTDGVLVGGEPWKVAAAGVAQRWMATGWALGRADADLAPGAPERRMRQAGFTDVESRAFVEPRAWSFEEIVGYLHSTSVCSEKALGEDAPIFEADLRAALAGAGGVFHEDFRSGYSIGRKPA